MNYKMSFAFLFKLIIFFSIPGCVDPLPENEKVVDTAISPRRLNYGEEVIDLEKVLDMENSVKVNVKYDHNFKTPKQYKGFLLRTIIDSIITQTGFDSTNGFIIFNCIDGYRPLMQVSKFYGKEKGYVVFKDLDITGEKSWPDSVSQKFGKYVLVWDNVPAADNSFSWPYGIKSIKLIQAGKEYKSIYPSNNALVSGFNVFLSHCIKCHSINNVGGLLAPEFNIPRNITEYWKEEDIMSYAKNPADFRLNSKMPPLNGLVSDSDLRELLRYIKHMKDRKATN